MSVHQQFAEDLALHALGALQGHDQLALEKHVEECATCRQELEQLRGDMALLAMSAAGPTPPRRARQRLMDALAREPRPSIVSQRRVWWALIPYFAAAALALVAVFLGRQNSHLREQLSDIRTNSGRQQAQLEQARQIVATFTGPEAMRVTLVAVKTPPQPQGKAFYLRSKAILIFLANNLPRLPSQKAYELWLIPASGAPIPAGVFKPDVHGSATVVNPPLPAGVEAKTFAITVEPETGSAAPTSQPIMVGSG